MMKEKKKSELKLRELKKWTLVKRWETILEFLWVDGMYCRWKITNWSNEWDIIIMWWANQNVSDYADII